MYDVRGKNAIVTGAARGFGREFARRLLAAGAKVTMSDVDMAELEKAAEDLRKQFGVGQEYVHFVKCDISKKEDWENLWDEAEEKLGGKVEVLCNNAGVPPQAGWEKNVEIMAVGSTRGIYMALERMGRSKGGNGGRIINTASVAGLTVGGIGGMPCAGYNIAKWGNVAATRFFAEAMPDVYATEGIKCYALCPYFADTKLVKDGCEDEANPIMTRGGRVSSLEDLQRVMKTRLLSPEEVGQAMCDAIRIDRTGAVYVVFPDTPLIEYPAVRNELFRAVVVAAKLVGARLGLEVFTPAHFFAIVGVAVFLACLGLRWILCCIC